MFIFYFNQLTLSNTYYIITIQSMSEFKKVTQKPSIPEEISVDKLWEK